MAADALQGAELLHGGGCAAVHDVRREDAAGRELLRVRELWEHERMQLMSDIAVCTSCLPDE